MNSIPIRKFYFLDLVSNYKIALLVIVSFIFNLSLAFSQNQVEKKSTGGTWYYEYLPADYSGNSKDYPIMFFFHGMGERGDTKGDLWEVAKNGPPKHVKNGHDFSFILISPQLKSDMGSWTPAYMDEVVDHVLNGSLRVDVNRIYITGLSLGGGGAWYYAQSFPAKIAAVAPICGSGNNTNKAVDIAEENVPVWAFHGDADGVVPVERTIDMINALNDASISPKAKITIYEGVGHDAWSNAYKTGNALHSPNIYEWFMKQSRTNADGSDSNTAPVADAGSNKEINLPTNSISINGSGSDSDGSISSYSWEKVLGGTATLNNINKARLDVSNLKAGVYKFELTVTDNDNATHTDLMRLEVLDNGNIKPVADAGPNKEINLPTNSISINGSGSDSDGSISSYSWEKVLGGTATLNNASKPKLEVSNLKAGVYKFELTVKDNDNATHTDLMRLEVLDNGNIKPVADAGPNKEINLPTNSIYIYGSGSDSDGSISSYSWEKVLGGTATLNNTSKPKLGVSNLKAGVYKFELTVTDNDNATHTDLMRLEVLDNGNIKPVADAGSNKQIKLPTNSISIFGSGSDSDGSISSYSWRKTLGGTATLNNTSKAKLEVSNLKAGIYKFELTVKDNDNATDTDLMRLEVLDGGNLEPIANAGKDFTITLPTNSAKLVGSGTDADGQITSYWWKKMSGPSMKISNQGKSTATISNLLGGTYTFQFKVVDDDGASTTDLVELKVLEATETLSVSVDQEEQKITLPTSTVDIQATATAPEGEIASFKWNIENAPDDAILQNETEPKVTVKELETPGEYVLSVTVSDTEGATNSATAIVKVNEEENIDNIRPDVDAGPDQFLVLPDNEIVLNGYASDPDGEIVSYLWEKVSGGTANLSGANSAALTASNLEEGSYHFRFTATDNDGAHKSNAVYVTVEAEDFNIAPIVDAGSNRAISLPKNYHTFSAEASDLDGEIVSYQWMQISGGNDYSISGINTSEIDISEATEGIYIFEITVEDNGGLIASDEVRLTVNAASNSVIINEDSINQPIFEAAQLSLVSDSISIDNVPDNVNIRWFYEDALQEQYNEQSKIPFYNSGAYVVVFESGDYSVTSELYEFVITTNELKIDHQSVRVYPNPVSDHYLNIQSSVFNSDEISLQLVDLNAQVVHLEKVSNNQLKSGYRMEFSNHLNPGIYQLKILDGSSLGVFKIMVK
ncbi:MAG: PKD domain-containing protein [Bacteroidota bacterium]